MPRQARVVIPGLPHHVTQRGNNRFDVFFTDDDRLGYLGLLREQCAKYGVRILGYCLMTNHIHLVAIPAREESLNLGVGRTHFIYTQIINRLHGRSGHLWQGRFHSCPMDDAYTVTAMRYVERNPVRAKMTRMPWTMGKMPDFFMWMASEATPTVAMRAVKRPALASSNWSMALAKRAR